MTTVRLWVRTSTGLTPRGADWLLAGILLAATSFVAGSLFVPAVWIALGAILLFAGIGFGAVGLLALWKMRIESIPRTRENWWSMTLSELYGFGILYYLAIGFIAVYLLFLESVALAFLISELFL